MATKTRQATAKKISPAEALLTQYLEEYDVEGAEVTVEYAQQYLDSLEDNVEPNTDDFDTYLNENDLLTEETEEESEEQEEEEDAERAPASKGISISDADATNFGRLLDTKPTLVAFIKESIEMDTRRRVLPAETAFHLKQEITEEELMTQPRPGSRYDDEPKPNKFDVRKPGEGSHYAEVFASMAEGIKINKPLGVLKQVLDKNNPIKMPAEYANGIWKGRTVKWLEQEKIMLDQRFKAGVKALKDAINILFRFVDVENKLKNVYADFRTETNEHGVEVLERTTAPIKVYTIVKNKKTGRDTEVEKYISISNFLRSTTRDQLKLIAASSDHFENFIPPKKARGKGKKNEPVFVNTAVQAVSATGDFAAGLGTADFKTAYLEILQKSDSDEELWDAHLLWVRLGGILAYPSLKKRIDAMIVAKEKAAKATDPMAKVEAS